jgi:hypothetical protein
LSCRRNSFLFPETEVLLDDSLNQTRQYFHITFLIHCLTRWNKFFVNDFQTVEEWDQHHFDFLLLKSTFLCLGERHSMLCIFGWGPYWKRQDSSPYCSLLKQGTVTIHRLDKLLTCLQPESLPFIGQIVRNKLSADLPFSEIFH